jgi:hypothetical protein
VFFRLGRSVYRKAKLLFREVGEASERLAVVSEQLQELADRSREPEPAAVFSDPSRLRQDRYLERRGERRGAERERQGTPRTSRSGRQRVR